MWRKIRDWQRAIDDETLLVLKHPEMAQHVKGRVRRCVANSLIKLSPIERQQFHDFMLKYRGAGFYIAAAKLMLILCALGVLLHLMLPEQLSWTKALVVSNGIGFAMAWGVLGVWFSYRKIAQKKVRLLAMLLVMPFLSGVAIGLLGSLLHDRSLGESLASGMRVGTYALMTAGLVYMVPMAIIATWRNRQHEALLQRLQQEAERERLARELSESQLRLLRAQIEPHFLFNTLGAVQQLAEQGAPKAAALTADLIAFLRASLAEMRSEQVALGSEFEMVGAYLRVMQARMGSRLRYRIELPPALSQVMVPSMILLTLAENAIKHGIEPSLRGGEVCVSASVVDAQLRLRVMDTGVGLAAPGQASAGDGLGLDNVRRRLQLAGSGSLLLRDNDKDGDGEERGVIADIILPAPSSMTSEKSAA